MVGKGYLLIFSLLRAAQVAAGGVGCIAEAAGAGKVVRAERRNVEPYGNDSSAPAIGPSA
jgi:hypothetical protein